MSIGQPSYIAGSSPASCRKSEIIRALDLSAYTTSFEASVLCTTEDVIKGPVDMEKTCPGYVEGSLACPSYRGKSQLLLRISLQNVTNCCMRNKALARLFRWPGHPPGLANFSPCKHFNSPWLGEVNWPNARQSFRACVRALSALSQ